MDPLIGRHYTVSLHICIKLTRCQLFVSRSCSDLVASRPSTLCLSVSPGSIWNEWPTLAYNNKVAACASGRVLLGILCLSLPFISRIFKMYLKHPEKPTKNYLLWVNTFVTSDVPLFSVVASLCLNIASNELCTLHSGTTWHLKGIMVIVSFSANKAFFVI